MTSADAVTEFPAPVRYELSLEDYSAMSRHVSPPERLRTVSWSFLLSICVAPTVVVAVVFPGYGVAFLAGVCVSIGALFVRGEQVRARAAQLLAPRPDGLFLCEHVATLDAEGLRVTTSRSTSEVRWPAILALEETEKHIFIRVDTVSAHVIPKRAFEAAESAERFVTCVRKCVTNRSAA